MMVNQMNNNPTPWQSTYLNGMPWLDPASTMQFGQTSPDPTNLVHSQPSVTTNISTTTLPSQPMLSPVTLPPATQYGYAVGSNVIHAAIGPTMGNPFDPQSLTGQQVTAATVQPQLIQDLYQMTPNPVTQDSHFASSSLTQLPAPLEPSSPTCSESSRPTHQKRSSVEMEDDLTVKEAPPTKQQLSENKLFKRFGTLQLDGEKLAGMGEEDADSDSSDESVSKDCVQDRKEFNRYVYLLFKDKKSNNLFNDATSGAMDRLIRDEREKLNKAVILWSPPLKESLINSMNQNDEDDDDDDDEFKYTDHKDFLKRSGEDDEDSIIITEVEDDVQISEEDQIDATDDTCIMQD